MPTAPEESTSWNGVPLQYWDTKPPELRDSLIVLMRTLELLSEALPIALNSVGTLDLRVQENFWIAFARFDQSTDFTSWAKDDVSDDRAEQLGALLEDWREIVEIRITKPEGEIK